MATYTVKKGDTLSSIAEKYGTTYQEIANANGISNPNMISVGQKLTIGGSSSGGSSSSKSSSSNTSNKITTSSGFTYDSFKVSDATAQADKDRQRVESSKPGAYQTSDAVNQAQTLLQQHISNKPSDYQSQWSDKINSTLDAIENREDFSYNVNSDALYQQYKDQYILQGQQAMMDTMGQAAAMTGGYGNSYAQTAGQQAYQGYLQKLNEVVPELYQLALDQYNQEGEDLYNQYELYSDRDDTDYNRYRDSVDDYYTELDYLKDDYEYQYDMDYTQYRDSVADWQSELDRADENYFNLYDRDYTEYSDNRTIAYDDYSSNLSSSSGSSSSGSSSSGTTKKTTASGGTFSSSNADKKTNKTNKTNNTTGTGVKSVGETISGAVRGYTDTAGNSGSGGFTGSTYSEAVAYLKKMGASNASGIMTADEWNRRKSSYQLYGTGGAEVRNYSSYKAYLADIVEYKLSNK